MASAGRRVGVRALRRVGLGVRVASGTLWAGLMLVSGLWTMAEGPARLPFVPGLVLLVAGATALGAGQFVFLVLVADRLFPRASRGLMGAVEGASFAVFAAGVGAMAWVVGTGH